jgi:hypothetical protein
MRHIVMACFRDIISYFNLLLPTHDGSMTKPETLGTLGESTIRCLFGATTLTITTLGILQWASL